MINAFIMAGQSNMSGRGALGELPEVVNEHVSVLHDTGWETAREPVVRDRPFSGEGMGTAFGSTLYTLTGCDTGLIPCSLGGSLLSEWQPGTELFEKTIVRTRQALGSGARIAGILWHQGEADSMDCEQAHTYLKRFIPMINEMKVRINAEAAALGVPEAIAAPLPVIAGELGDYLDMFEGDKYHREVNAQLNEFASYRPEYACVRARDLAQKGDNLHFSTRSQRILGVRYACAWMDIAAKTGIRLL